MRWSLRLLSLAVVATLAAPELCRSADDRTPLPVQEEIWALPLIQPTIAYVAHPIGSGPFPLAVMNHGVSLDPRERSFFPLVEFRDAGLAVALFDKWIIDYMTEQKLAKPDSAIVIGQSAGGWAAIALSSENLPSVKAIITFAAGRGGRVGGKPNNNCAPDKLVEAAGAFGRTARVPMLWFYIENDTYFGPDLSRRMHQTYTAAGGNAEYHLMPPFGTEGHFFIDSPDAIPHWSPLVTQFLDKHR